MESSLALLFGLLGAAGLGALLKIILGYANRTQAAFNAALEEQRKGFETFLGNHMSGQTKATENLVRATERMSDRLVEQHEETRTLIRDQAKIVRDGHRKMGQLMVASRAGGKKIAEALDDVMNHIEESDQNGR